MFRDSQEYWDKHKEYYPFRTNVRYMSKEDIDPKKFCRMANEDFLRVPFEGRTYWGFKTEKCLKLFQSQGRL